MVLGWKTRIGRRRAGKKQQPGNLDLELRIPTHFRCPISLDIMKDPVTLSSGITYDRESIETWLGAGNFTCPVTNLVLMNFDRIPNHTLRKMIQDWCVVNSRFGVERIPTPRVPITATEAAEIVFNMGASIRRLDSSGCLELVHKIKECGNEIERNKKCVAENGGVGILAAAFEAFAADSIDQNAALLEEIMYVLNGMLPYFDSEANTHLGSKASLHCIVWFLRCGDYSAMEAAILTLQELLSSGEKHVEEVLEDIEDVHGTLFKLIKEPICPTITKSCLMVVFYLVSSSNEKIKSEFVEVGMVPTLLEILVDSEKAIAERALGVFDRLCSCEDGIQQAYRNALTVPVLVKKILRVSDLATEFSVSAIWKLCKCKKWEEEGAAGVLVEALQVGVFQKVLLLLQVGCGEQTKEKATEVLKLLNPYRDGLECIETVDFRSLKRSF